MALARTSTKPSTGTGAKAPPRLPNLSLSLAIRFALTRVSPPSPRSRHVAMQAAQEHAVTECIARFRAENPSALDEELQRVAEESLARELQAAEDDAETLYGSPTEQKRQEADLMAVG
ncbi:hypothetical protein K488DRAFT_89391 [Vararia minispora EC-137]|uniref:Uncharacterized protein n=1 Tax=Vararia minispora EC-137 TaxID=1314806 RepID=A0ACB8QAN1_9AGAM|nr:hypothetical protein K488DRAFT_89391 [Vararia minispora EC-137]